MNSCHSAGAIFAFCIFEYFDFLIRMVLILSNIGSQCKHNCYCPIHHIEGHKGKILDFAAVEAERCDIIFDYHTAELLRYSELGNKKMVGPAGIEPALYP